MVKPQAATRVAANKLKLLIVFPSLSLNLGDHVLMVLDK